MILDDAAAVMLAGTLSIGLIYGLYTATRPSQYRWLRPPAQPDQIRPEEDSERLVDQISRGPIRIHGAIRTGGVPVTARWEVDLSVPRHGSWRVDVGPFTDRAGDLAEVYEIARVRLAAIAESKREQRRGRHG